MPQVDFESLVSSCAGGYSDRKVACETIAGDEQDWPPESIWLSGDAEYDWWDRNAAVVYERKESTKGSSIFSSSTNLNPNSSNSNSQRFSKNLKSKAAIIGLPKSQKSAFADASMSRRHHIHSHRPGSSTLFPKRSVSVGKSGSAVVFEPSSPKVSCMGKVRSRRDRNRRLRTRQRSSSSSSTAVTATVTAAVERQKSSSRRGRRRAGFFESVRAIFRSRKSVPKTDLASEDSISKKNKKKNKNKKRSNSRKTRGGDGGGDDETVKTVWAHNDASFEDSVSTAPAGLGSLNRFASGRRSESWASGR